MGVVMGLAAAMGWGISDFLAGYATRAIGSYRALLYMQVIGLVGLTAYVLATGALFPLSTTSWRPWAWAAVAALLSTASLLALFRAYEVGDLSIAAPINAAFPVVTVVLSLLSGEHLSGAQELSIAVTLAGIVLACYAPRPGTARRVAHGAEWAVVSALTGGSVLWALGFKVTPYLGAVVPVWIVRILTPAVLLLCAAPLRQTLAVPRGSVWRLLLAMGVLDTAGLLASAEGVRIGPVAVVSVLTSLFSVVTLLLARLFLDENLRHSQWVGIALTLAGVTIVNAGA